MASSVQIEVLFFAKSRELVGKKQCILTLPELTTAKQLLKDILETFPSLAPIGENLVLSLNEDYISTDNTENIQLRQGDELAVIPPISGG